jgi:hypothetical protein
LLHLRAISLNLLVERVRVLGLETLEELGEQILEDFKAQEDEKDDFDDVNEVKLHTFPTY